MVVALNIPEHRPIDFIANEPTEGISDLRAAHTPPPILDFPILLVKSPQMFPVLGQGQDVQQLGVTDLSQEDLSVLGTGAQ